MALIPNLRSFKHTTNDGIAKPVIAPHTYPYGFGVGDDLYTVSAASNRPKADAPKLIQAAPQAFLDTPPLVYSDWNKAVGSNSNSAIDQPLGTLPSSLRICLIGGGISNLAAAFELAKAGAQVHLYEANAEVGGRLLSKLAIDGQSEAEMGAMRFPPSEDLLYYYSKSLGFAFMQGFPDPGLKPTIISYQGRVQEWHDRAAPPEGFATVYNGWIAFIEKGLQNPKPGQKVLESAIQLQKWLVDPKQRHQVPAAWQLYLDTFKNDTFLDGLQRIFGGDAQWEVPGGTVWSDDDFNRFGALGVGSGGFGPLFGIAFNTVFRLIPNGLETDQAIFCIPNVDHTDGTPVGIQQLALALKKKAIRAGATIVTNTFADLVSNDQGVVTVSLKPNGLALSMQTRMFDFVIVGTTTAAMAINMSVAGNFAPNAQFVSEQIANSITNVHITSSSKLFLRTKRFWASQTDPLFTRNILSDTAKLPQVYTLEYGDPDYGMVLLTYTWEDQSNQIVAFNDPQQLLDLLKIQVNNIMEGTDYPKWADNLVPVTPEDLWYIHWQAQPNFNGAFVLGQPGDDALTARMFLDFLKLSDKDHPPVLLNGDSIGFTGGWVDGGLQCAMNTVSAVLKRYGSLSTVNGADKLAPVNLMGKTHATNPYKY